MRACAHVTLAESLRERVASIKRLTLSYEKEHVGLCCDQCQNKENLFVSCECGTVLCSDHMSMPCESGDVHRVFFNIDQDTVYCRLCDLNFKLSDNEAYRQLRNKETRAATYNRISLKKFADLGQTSYIGVLLQVILNYTPVRDYFFGFHHSLFECSIPSCPDCFFKKIYSQIYSSNPVDLSEAVYFIYKRTRHHVPFKIKNVKHAFRLLCNSYHPDGCAAENCRCILHRVFFGEQTLEEECTICRNTSVSVEQFIMMEFGRHRNLSVAVNEYLTTNVSGKSLYCKACLNTVPIYQKVTLTRFPKLLCVYLNRFAGDAKDERDRFKIWIDKELSVQGRTYDLYAFVEHKGSSYGYYICYILFSGEWYEFNRNKIMSDVNVGLRTPNATMLFYALNELG